MGDQEESLGKLNKRLKHVFNRYKCFEEIFDRFQNTFKQHKKEWEESHILINCEDEKKIIIHFTDRKYQAVFSLDYVNCEPKGKISVSHVDDNEDISQIASIHYDGKGKVTSTIPEQLEGEDSFSLINTTDCEALMLYWLCKDTDYSFDKNR